MENNLNSTPTSSINPTELDDTLNVRRKFDIAWVIDSLYFGWLKNFEV